MEALAPSQLLTVLGYGSSGLQRVDLGEVWPGNGGLSQRLYVQDCRPAWEPKSSRTVGSMFQRVLTIFKERSKTCLKSALKRSKNDAKSRKGVESSWWRRPGRVPPTCAAFRR